MVCGIQEDNSLAGLLLLAQPRAGGRLIGCGAPQAEYYVWLAREQESPFIADALKALWNEFPRGRLYFTFLPPHTPLGWRNGPSSHVRQTVIQPIDRPLHVLSADSGAESLKKKSNRSRLNRLERIAPVTLKQVRSRDELLPYIDCIADYLDLRQGALNGDRPFRDDALKREFILRLAADPEVCHCTLLMLGDRVIAVHFGFRNRSDVVLGLIAHSPFVARHSPGKFLMLFLFSQLAAEGYVNFDLTPGGAYKDRFQNGHDEAYIFTALARRRDYLAYRGSLIVRGWGKTALGRMNLNKHHIEAVGKFLKRRALITVPMRGVAYIGRKISSSEDLRYYIAPQAGLNVPPGQDIISERFRVDKIEDLLLYRPATAGDTSVQEFLKIALDRIEEGNRVYTLVEKGVLLHYAWVGPRSGEVPSGVGNTFHFPEGSYVLWDDYTHPTARGRGYHKASLYVRARDAVRDLGAAHVYINVFANNLPSRRNIEKLGFIYQGSMIRRSRWGSSEIFWKPAPDAALASVPVNA